MQAQRTAFDEAAIIGGGTGGLITAQLLAKHYGCVTIYDTGKGAPQNNHAHILLEEGYKLVTEVFPNFRATMLAKGANEVDFTRDIRLLLPKGWIPTKESGIKTLVATKGLIEWALRKEVTENPKIRIVTNAYVSGLEMERGAVTGVSVTSGGRHLQTSKANLVVDASGSNSQASKWLEEAGFGTPKADQIVTDIGCASMKFRIDKLSNKDWKMVILNTRAPDMPKMGYLMKIEGAPDENNYLVSMGGMMGNHPPTDLNGFKQFASTLAHPVIREALEDAVPISEMHGFRVHGSKMYHYDKMERWPGNFIVTGDAYSRTNPFYGQGMTIAALQASAVDRTISSYKQAGTYLGLAKECQISIAKASSLSWLLATGEDLRWAHSGDRIPYATKVMHKYIDAMILASPGSIKVTKALLKLVHMSAPPAAIFDPRVVAEIVKARILRKPISTIMPR
ncbi:MAG TPA: FAD-dependent monooxygenase [Candidatus Acidoferrales bacterium]|nr:FAD-dependent monooxygenase [Candidatus Acidoferrales bacterium]